MANKFHINSTGDVKPCAATKNACQFGDGSLHFDTPEDARRAAETILEQSPDGNALRGKKSSLTDVLLKSIRAQDKRAPLASAAPTSRKQRIEELTKSMSDYGYYPVDRAHRAVLKSLRAGVPGGDLVRTFKNRSGDYKALALGKDGKLYTLTAPPTRDIPFPMADFESWSMSFHPNGPKTQFACGGCGRTNSARLGEYSQRVQNDFRIRCSSCGQMNQAQIRFD